jgi:U5 small nuclear ribonucleoprotein component
VRSLQSSGPRAELMTSFMIDMMDHPAMMRNVMVGGAIHHGKTSLLDMLR